MRPEQLVGRVLIKVLAIMAVVYIFYAVMVEIDRSAPKISGAPGFLQRVKDVFSKGLHIKSPYISEDEIRQKARQYVR